MTAVATENRCACGAEISRWSVSCNACRVKRIIASAKVVEPSAPLNLVDSETYWFDLSEASEFNAGEYAHPCDEEPLRVNAKRLAEYLEERVVEDMCEEAFEDAEDYLKGRPELLAALEAALEAFNAAQTASSWSPRVNEVFVIPALAAATGTAKTAKQAECEASQSGPKGNAQ